MSENVEGSFGRVMSATFSIVVVAGVIVTIWVTGEDRAVSTGSSDSNRVLESRGGPIFALGWSPDGSKLATSRDGTLVTIHDVGSGDRRTLKLEPGVARMALGWSADGRSVMVWGLDNLVEFRPIDGSTPVLEDSLVDVGLIAATIGGGSVRLWGPEDRRSDRLGFATIQPHAMAFAPDGRTAVWGGSDGVVGVTEVGTGRELWRASSAAHQPGVHGIGAVAFSPDGSTVASAGVGPIRVWHASSGTDRARLGDESAGSTFVTFSPDGTRLAEASWDGSVRVWDLESGRQVAKFSGQTCRVAALAWSPDGRTVAVGTFEGTVRLWDAKTNATAAR